MVQTKPHTLTEIIKIQISTILREYERYCQKFYEKNVKFMNKKSPLLLLRAESIFFESKNGPKRRRNQT